MNDLDVLFPEGIQVPTGEGVITVLPISFGKLPKVTKYLIPIVAAFAKSNLLSVLDVPADGNTPAQKKIVFTSDWMTRIADILAIGGEDLMELVALGISKPRSFLDTVPMDVGFALTRAVLEINADLFLKKVLPMLGMQATPTPAPDGVLLSENSSGEGTSEKI